MQYTLRTAFVKVFKDLSSHAPSAGFLVLPHAVLEVGKVLQVRGTIAQDDTTTCMDKTLSFW